jgi:predicted nucleotidyltransferase
MNKADLLNLVETPEYKFLHENEHLKDRIMFLTLGGSHAYGTNVVSSDVDIRGCCLDRPSDLIGLSAFEQVLDNATDTTVYSFRKLISLLMNCNPNCIELLGCKPEHYIMVSDTGREFINNYKLFLSKKAVHSFGGYATAQLRRLQNAVCHDSLTDNDREIHIFNSVKNAFTAIQNNWGDHRATQLVNLRIAESVIADGEKSTDIVVDLDLRGFPLREFNGMFSQLTDVIRQYDKLGKRNTHKTAEGLDKHAMHLVRLYLMCFDILEKEEINTFRENDIPMLMEIRSGKYRNPDGTYMQEFFDMITKYEKRLEYATENTALPKNPDYKRIEEFVMNVNRKAIGG